MHVDEGRELTLSELVKLLEKRFQLELSLIACRGHTLYSSLAPPARQKAWLQLGVRTVVAEAIGQLPRDQTIFMQVKALASLHLPSAANHGQFAFTFSFILGKLL